MVNKYGDSRHLMNRRCVRWKFQINVNKIHHVIKVEDYLLNKCYTRVENYWKFQEKKNQCMWLHLWKVLRNWQTHKCKKMIITNLYGWAMPYLSPISTKQIMEKKIKVGIMSNRVKIWSDLGFSKSYLHLLFTRCIKILLVSYWYKSRSKLFQW